MEIPEFKKFPSQRKILVFHRGLMDVNCNGPIVVELDVSSTAWGLTDDGSSAAAREYLFPDLVRQNEESLLIQTSRKDQEHYLLH